MVRRKLEGVTLSRVGSCEYAATIELAGSPHSSMAAQVTVAGDTITVVAAGHPIGTWRLSTVGVSRIDDVFALDAEGERLLIEVDDPDGFGRRLGTGPPKPAAPATVPDPKPPPQRDAARTSDGPRHRQSEGQAPWWQFWRAGVWRDWLGRRRHWREYRTEVEPLRAQIRGLRATIAERGEGLAEAERHLRWARELQPIEVPIHLRGAETAVASFPGVQLFEPQRTGNRSGWMPIDEGMLYVTDRRLVFAGDQEVCFEYVDVTSVVKTPIGLLIGMASSQEYVISGPADQLAVSMEAAHRGGRGLSPTAPFAASVKRTGTEIEGAEDRMAGLKAQVSLLEAPTRPVSPAWIPAAALAIVALVGTGLNWDRASDPTLAAGTTQPASESETEVLGLVVGATDLVWSLELVGPSSNPDGRQGDSPTEGWIRIRNTGADTAQLSGWAIVDASGSHRYDLPLGLSIPPGEGVTIHAGCGIDRATELHWCNTAGESWSSAGASLIDPGGRTIARYHPADSQ